MQTVLAGMGELHLEIIKSRLQSEYKIDADLGPLQIAYRETIEVPVRDVFVIKKDISGTNQEVHIEMSLCNDKLELFSLDNHPDAAHALSAIHAKYIKHIKTAVSSAFERGPLIGGKVIDTQVTLHSLVLGKKVAESFLMSATSQCIYQVCAQEKRMFELSFLIVFRQLKILLFCSIICVAFEEIIMPTTGTLDGYTDYCSE